jgi:hypothetical protein
MESLPPRPYRKLVAFLFVFFLTHASVARCTTVIAIVTPKGIIVGTDAKIVTTVGVSLSPVNSAFVAQKIQLVVNNRILVASAGLESGPNYKFETWIQEISRDLPKDISVEDFVAVLERESATKFQNADIELATSQFKPPPFEFCRDFIQYLVVGYQGGRPRVYGIEYHIDWERKHLVGPRLTAYHAPENHSVDLGLYSIGEVGAITELGNRDSYAHKQASLHAPGILEKLSSGQEITECEASKLIRALIKIEEGVSPTKVGGVGRFFYIPAPSGTFRESKCISLPKGSGNKKAQRTNQ